MTTGHDNFQKYLDFYRLFAREIIELVHFFLAWLQLSIINFQHSKENIIPYKSTIESGCRAVKSIISAALSGWKSRYIVY